MAEHTTNLDDILTQCLEAIEAGEWTAEDCLARYPAYRSDLEPMLEVALRLRLAQALRPSTAFQRQAPARLRARLQASRRPPLQQSTRSVTKQPQPRFIGRIWMPYRLRRSGVLAILAAIVIVVGAAFGGVVYAADSASPGDPLYGVDQVVEEVRLRLASGNEEQMANLYLDIAEERVFEAIDVAESGGQAENIDVALQGFDDAISALQSLVDGGTLSPEQQTVIEQAIAGLQASRDAASLSGASVEVEFEDGELDIEVDSQDSEVEFSVEDSGVETSIEDAFGDLDDDDDEHDLDDDDDDSVDDSSDDSDDEDDEHLFGDDSSGDDDSDDDHGGGGGGGGDDHDDDHGGGGGGGDKKKDDDDD